MLFRLKFYNLPPTPVLAYLLRLILLNDNKHFSIDIIESLLTKTNIFCSLQITLTY